MKGQTIHRSPMEADSRSADQKRQTTHHSPLEANAENMQHSRLRADSSLAGQLLAFYATKTSISVFWTAHYLRIF